MSRLDVLVPHFRDPEGLALSLASVAAQGWTGDLRLVIVDDGSPEAEFRAVEALAAGLDLPAAIARNPTNRGRPYTRNRLLDMVEGDFVAWIDAGDVWYPSKLERQFEHLAGCASQGADVGRVWVTCNYDWQWSGRRARHTTPGGERRSAQGADARLQAPRLSLDAARQASSFRAIGPLRRGAAAAAGSRLLHPLRARRRRARGAARGARRSAATTSPTSAATPPRSAPATGGSWRSTARASRATGRTSSPTIRYNAETLSARYAKNNGDTLTRARYLARAFAADPKRTLGARPALARAGRS